MNGFQRVLSECLEHREGDNLERFYPLISFRAMRLFFREPERWIAKGIGIDDIAQGIALRLLPYDKTSPAKFIERLRKAKPKSLRGKAPQYTDSCPLSERAELLAIIGELAHEYGPTLAAIILEKLKRVDNDKLDSSLRSKVARQDTSKLKAVYGIVGNRLFRKLPANRKLAWFDPKPEPMFRLPVAPKLVLSGLMFDR